MWELLVPVTHRQPTDTKLVRRMRTHIHAEYIDTNVRQVSPLALPPGEKLKGEDWGF